MSSSDSDSTSDDSDGSDSPVKPTVHGHALATGTMDIRSMSGSDEEDSPGASSMARSPPAATTLAAAATTAPAARPVVDVAESSDGDDGTSDIDSLAQAHSPVKHGGNAAMALASAGGGARGPGRAASPAASESSLGASSGAQSRGHSSHASPPAQPMKHAGTPRSAKAESLENLTPRVQTPSKEHPVQHQSAGAVAGAEVQDLDSDEEMFKASKPSTPQQRHQPQGQQPREQQQQQQQQSLPKLPRLPGGGSSPRFSASPGCNEEEKAWAQSPTGRWERVSVARDSPRPTSDARPSASGVHVCSPRSSSAGHRTPPAPARREESDEENKESDEKRRRQDELRQVEEARRRRREEEEAAARLAREQAEAEERLRLEAEEAEALRRRKQREREEREEDERRLRQEAEEARARERAAAVAAAAAEEERKRREAEAREVKKREDAIWAAMTPEEATRARGMLQAVALYHQQLEQNERVIGDLQQQIASKEKAFRTTRRRVQQATDAASLAREQEAQSREELLRWGTKRQQYERGCSGIELLRSQHEAMQEELTRLRSEAEPAKRERESLRDRLASCEHTGREQASRLQALKARCQQAVVAIKSEHVQELSELRAQQMEELAKIEVESSTQVGTLKAQHAEEVAHLKQVLEDACRRRDRLRQDKELAADQLMTKQRESTQMQQQCADKRAEVEELTAQVKSFQAMPRFISQLGLAQNVEASMSVASMSFQQVMGDDLQADAELHEMRMRCKSLERECAHTHDALEKKQAECERWRRRGLEYGSRAMVASTPTLIVPSSADGAAGPRADTACAGPASPFTLGPMESEVAAGHSFSSPLNRSAYGRGA